MPEPNSEAAPPQGGAVDRRNHRLVEIGAGRESGEPAGGEIPAQPFEFKIRFVVERVRDSQAVAGDYRKTGPVSTLQNL
jgi:hypothetical protein